MDFFLSLPLSLSFSPSSTGPDQASDLAMCYADSDAERCLNCLATMSPINKDWIPSCYHSRNVLLSECNNCLLDCNRTDQLYEIK